MLRQVGLKSGPAKLPAIADLNSTISFAGGRAIIEPTTLTLGSAHLNLNGKLASLSPLSAGYALAADSVKLGEIFPGRPPGELMNRPAVTGTAEGALESPDLKARIVSPDGTVNQGAYTSGVSSALPFSHLRSSRRFARVSSPPISPHMSLHATAICPCAGMTSAVRSALIDC